MASPLPQPTAPSPSIPLRPPSTAPLPTHFTSPAVANSFRLTKVVERFVLHFKGGAGAGAGARFDTSDFFHLCFALARGIDYALTINDVPEIVHCLPSIIKQVYQRKHETSLQSAIMVLLISAKNACKFGWFNSSDADEILNMTNELCSSFCMTVCVTIEVENSLDIISKIMPRFYPQLTFCSLIVSFEAKPGYEILMADFQIPRNMPPEQKIRLIVVQTDNLETSSCIINPPHVSFMVNGKGVEKRTNVSLDSGPQFPTDITKMLKYGTNLIQAIGYFSGTYLMALAFMSQITSSSAPVLKDYVQPAVATLDSDSEIVVGPSRITLNCPISFRRIRTPVKGHLCKHHQCFDYDNFMEMNSRKPSWRCPCCNQCVSCIDLCIDRNMVKILEEVGEDVVDIVISADGSWKAIVEHHESTGQPHNGTLEGQQDSNMGCESSKFGNTPPDAVDLTMVEDDERDTAICRSDSHDVETEERKPPIYSSIATQWPFFQIGNDISPRISSTSSLNGSLNHTGPDAHSVGTLDSFFPGVLVNPVITDAISPAPNREPMASLGTSQPSFSFQHLLQTGQHTENMQLQQHSQFGNSVINSGTERAPIPRLVSRTPVAVQALPAQTQATSSSQRIRTNPLTLSSMISSGYSSTTYPTGHGMAANSGLYALSGDRDMQQILRTSEISMTQDRDNQDPHHTSYSSSHVVGLPAPNLISTRLPSSQHRGAGAYRSPLQPPSNFQNPNRDLSNLRKHPTTQNLPVTFRSSSGFSSSSIGNDSAAQRAAAAARLLAGSVSPQVSRTAPSNTPTSDSVRLSSNEQLRSMPEVPLEQNWRPTGRMRGSLTGSAYSAALSHYLVPPTQPVPSRPPAPTVASSTSEQLSALITNSINAHNPAT